MLKKLILFCTAILLTFACRVQAQETETLPPLHVDGRWLCDEDGNHVNLHGFGQTYSPWFNEQGNGWGWGYDVNACLNYNKGLIDQIIAKGWECNWMRLHMDPHWSNTPGVSTSGESDISAFSMTRFKKYLTEVFIPMAQYANAHGLYVVMRPPGVCPKEIAVGDAYHQYLLKVWGLVAHSVSLKNNPGIMFELANEPVNMKGTDGQYTSWSDGSAQKNTEFFQAIVDTIRACGANNILWVPGLGYQSQYAGFAKYPVQGENIGYAVHCYPGWYGSDSEADNGSAEQGVVTKGAGYAEFWAGWNNQVMPCAQMSPILITEMDWAPQSYNCSWGKATTGEAGGVGFGANFKYIMDKTGNVSWMTFTGPEWLARYDDNAPDGKTFLTDPEACVRPIYRWFKEYADPAWQFEDTLALKTLYFPGTEVGLNPSIWETGSFVASTGALVTGKYGFGGWQFGNNGIDLSDYKYLVVKLRKAPTTGGWSFRLFDQNNYWSDPYMINVNKTQVVVPLERLYRTVNGSVSSTNKVDRKKICIAGFWSYGGTTLYLDHLYLTNNDDYSEETAIDAVINDTPETDGRLYNLCGQVVDDTTAGQVMIRNGKKILIRN